MNLKSVKKEKRCIFLEDGKRTGELKAYKKYLKRTVNM